MNIFLNAIQAIPEQGGTLSIRARADKERVYIEIEDNGEGIPEDVLEHVFDPFFTTKKTGDGTGLGLSISYGIIQKHHGEISYKSTLNKGTTCYIQLPIN